MDIYKSFIEFKLYKYTTFNTYTPYILTFRSSIVAASRKTKKKTKTKREKEKHINTKTKKARQQQQNTLITKQQTINKKS